ncbi:MAG TPA: hypothetical protein VNT01_09215 [Symbiobacteriaceae bacterium]|nr:hypothetical protein [Symbiobacteriaceae bacterium]
MQKYIRHVLGLLLAAAFLLAAGCDSAILASHSDGTTGMKGSFKSRNGVIRSSAQSVTGDFQLSVTNFELKSGNVKIRLEDAGGKTIWEHDMVPADTGKALQVSLGDQKPSLWVVQFSDARDGRYDLSWGGK